MPKSDLASRRLRRYREQFAWPLALAVVLLVAKTLVPERKAVTRIASNRQPDAVHHP
jgi:hypothetical protein